MAFWSSETLRVRLPSEGLVTPYHERFVEHCAYELGLGPEAFITSTEDKKRVALASGDPLVIPPGQFGLLLTDEVVAIPRNAIGLISMKFGVKRQGLVNVSGFHVDPGFKGRLKFSVYNAGSRDITLVCKDRVFLIWFCSLDRSTKDVYGVPSPDQNVISASDHNIMQGDIASPGQLRKELDEVRHFYSNNKLVLTVIVTALVAILGRFLFITYCSEPSPQTMERLKHDIRLEMMEDVRKAIREELDGRP